MRPKNKLHTLITLLMLALPVAAQTPYRDFTTFQTASPWTPHIDLQSDVVMVYGIGQVFVDRAQTWKDQDYTISHMTGISWGNYGAHYSGADNLKVEEIQTNKLGRVYMHGNSSTVGYNVPRPAYIQFIKDQLDPVIDFNPKAIFLEEPEYWAATGWSQGFKDAWQEYYGTPWEAPDSSVDAQYKASKLKYELYYNALKETTEHIKRRAAENNHHIECHVPTHSLINYAHWGIVSPESHLMDLDTIDGYIAQVWTGTSRTPNIYKGTRKERTFEAAYLEYGQMLGMVRPTGRKVWFLADPIEDNPNYSWANYKENYECTLIASLLWPEVNRYEVMPWPRRIFQGTYPKIDLAKNTDDKEGIPADYATQILTINNALSNMPTDNLQTAWGTEGIGILVSDTLMFQRAAPRRSDNDLSSFYGLALPFVKQGIPLNVVQLETIITPNTLNPYKLLILTYEGQKPLKPEYHDVLAQWVEDGGALLFVGDASDPYHHVKSWWNDNGFTQRTATDALEERLGLDNRAYVDPVPIGKGWVLFHKAKPRQIARYPEASEKLLQFAQNLLHKQGLPYTTQNYLQVQRGPYLIASVLDESSTDTPLKLQGNYIDLFDAQLPIIQEKTLQPNQRTLLYDLDWNTTTPPQPQVLACAGRVTNTTTTDTTMTFTIRGPTATTARARVRLPKKPADITILPQREIQHHWDPASQTLWLQCQHSAEPITLTIHHSETSPN